MENNPLVSIVIPAYNVEKYIGACLDSCVKQTYRNLEVIVVNDGSPDGSGDIIDQYVRCDGRFHQLRQENQGVAVARDNGVKAAHGEYVMFVDADDFLTEDAVEKYIQQLSDDSIEMVFSDFYVYYDDSKCNVHTFGFDKIVWSGLELLKLNGNWNIYARIIRRELLLGCKIQTLNMGEDLFILIQLLRKCHKVLYLKRPCYYYRIHGGSLMNSPTTVKNSILHKLFLIEYLLSEDYPEEMYKISAMEVAQIVARYCSDYENPVTSGMKKEVALLIKKTLNIYPEMLRENLFTKNFRPVIIMYILRFFPNMAWIICHYSKWRGKK